MRVEEKYADPQVVAFWQQLGREGLQQAEAAMVERYLPPGSRLLDLGCGAGRAVLALNQAGYQVTGIDLSVAMLQAGRGLSAEMRLSGANLLSLPFAPGAFEAAFMFFGALQHIPGQTQRRRALAEMGRVVGPGGRLLLGLDNLAPALLCYAYWLIEKISGSQTGEPPRASGQAPAAADATLWQRRTHPLVWHLRGVARTLRWRTWPGLLDLTRRLGVRPGGAEPGDSWVAQFSQPATPGLVYYHRYAARELIGDAASAGWRLLSYHSGRELSENLTDPLLIRARAKQLFFAFER